jgi:hypothetical protein
MLVRSVQLKCHKCGQQTSPVFGADVPAELDSTISCRGQQLLAHQPFPTRISPRHEVYEVGGAVLTLIFITILL